MFSRISKRVTLILSAFAMYVGALILAHLFVHTISLWEFISRAQLLLITDSVILIGLMLITGLDNVSLKNAGISEGFKILSVSTILFIVNLIESIYFPGLLLRWSVLHFFLFTTLLSCLYFFNRMIRHLVHYTVTKKADKKNSVIIVGAGEAGAALVHDMLSSDHAQMYPICFVDDDPKKQSTFINGVKVKGTIADLPDLCEKYSPKRVAVAIPSASPDRLKEILAVCQDTGCKVTILPSLLRMVRSDAVSARALREIDVQDLLGREPIQVDMGEIKNEIREKTVLVTGGGGSIGSELCRQLATYDPKRLIVFDIYENNAYDLEQELRRKHPDLNLTVLIGSVRDKRKVDLLFTEYRPQIVFNAAAHKHVPLMENSPNEAVKNNVFGTLNVALAAERHKAEKFVQISTDKAVNPTNIMGATKRIGEMIIQTIGRRATHTKFVAVRFGNVLGSNGSVIPLFKRQIAEGGPVTVTHRDIIRYFMTIPEAVSLVLQACCYACAGEIFVFDMGEPVKIYDLATNLIKLSGLEPGKDIEIVCVGLRPGEKLYEERLMAEEGMQQTANQKINIGKPLEIDEEKLFSHLEMLEEAAEQESENIKELVARLVPTYKIDK